MLITNFSGGEISNNLYGRVDLPLYQNSVSSLENFDVMPQGGIKRRYGSIRVGILKGESRLIPFIINNSLSFIFEIGAEYIRIWKNGQLLTNAGYPIEFLSTTDLPLYKKAEIKDIQTAQTYDSIYLAHRHYKPYVIKWQGGDVFTLSSLPIIGNAHKLPFQDKDSYPACVAIFSGRLFFASSFKAPQRIWASKVFEYDNFTYFETIVSKTKQLKPPKLRVFTATAKKGSKTLTNLTKDFTEIVDISNYFITGHKAIPSGTKVVSVTENTMTLTNAVTEDKEDIILSIHLWKDTENPSEEDYQILEVVNNITTPSHAFTFEIASEKNDAIKWLTAAKDLIIGTECSEWIIPEAVNAHTVQAQLQSRYGSSNKQALLIGRSVIYIGQGGRSLRDYIFDYNERSYKSIDLTQAANHLLKESKACDFDVSNTPSPKIYLTRENGTVCVLLYDRNIGIAAWSNIILGSGYVNDLAVIPGDKGYDEIYFEVKKDNNYYLEKIEEEDGVYLDGCSPFTRKTRTDEYKLSSVFIKSTGQLYELNNLPEEFKDFSEPMYIGYPYKSLVTSLPVINSFEHTKKRIVSLSIRFLNSYMPVVAQKGTPEQKIYKEEPYSGICDVAVQGGFDTDVFFSIETTQPQPCTILSINANLA